MKLPSKHTDLDALMYVTAHITITTQVSKLERPALGSQCKVQM